MKLLKSSKKMKILFVGPEVTPFVKVGGLGEVLHALPKALREIGHDARVLIPKYASIDDEKFPMETVVSQMTVPDATLNDLICNVKQHQAADGTTTYFLENQEYYEKRSSVYGYDDDAARWALLSRGAIEFVRHHTEWKPDIIVANDWQCGLIPNYLKSDYKDDPALAGVAVLFIIHNIHYQGMYDYRHISELDYDDGQSDIPSIVDPRLFKLNFMRRGIRFADIINTVSPTYAREITTPEFGELLDPLLQERRSRLFGILNGINYDHYNPETNPYLEHHYNTKNIEDRKENKTLLQRKFNLPERHDVFVVAMVSRLSEQKGFDLVMEALEPLLQNFEFQFIVLGSGDSRYMSYFEELSKRNKNVVAHLSYDDVLPHVLYAGADAVLIPSRFEPCGLTQMEAMRYGAVPIVRRVGGLADSVTDVDTARNTGTGFIFDQYDHYALFGAFVRALETYRHPTTWNAIVKRAMATNFSWEKSAQEYVKLFERAISRFEQ
jgi:starch synthase